MARLPDLDNAANVSGEQVLQIASKSFTNINLMKFGRRVSTRVNQANLDGILVTHGTALAANGALNLFDAVSVAASKDSGMRGVPIIHLSCVPAG